MPPTQAQKHPLVHAVASTLLILGLIVVERQWSIMDHFSRATLCGGLGLLGFHCAWEDGFLVLESLRFSWNDACSGVNGLILYWVIVLWANRLRLDQRATIIGFFLAPPLALFANLLRVGVLVLYRTVYFPEVESMSLHYLIGFLGLLPGILLISQLKLIPVGFHWSDLIYLSALFSLLLAMGETPGFVVLGACTLAILYENQHNRSSQPNSLWVTLAWFGAGAVILVSRMESLWLPWLLLHPNYWSFQGPFTKFVLLVGTVSLVVMQPVAQVILALALAFWWWSLRQSSKNQGIATEPASIPQTRLAKIVTSLVILPFVAPLTYSSQSREVPKFKGVFVREYSANNHELRLIGQPADLRVFLFRPDGGGRHHALKTCMGFRGVTLNANADFPRVLEANNTYYAEAFFIGGKLRRSYRDYLLATAIPFGTVGHHLVITSPSRSVSPEYFDRVSTELFDQLHSGYEPR